MHLTLILVQENGEDQENQEKLENLKTKLHNAIGFANLTEEERNKLIKSIEIVDIEKFPIKKCLNQDVTSATSQLI